MTDYKGLEWNKLGFWDKTKLFNKWSVVCFLANSSLLIGVLLYTVSELKDIDWAEIFIGFGCMLTWASFTSYIESATEYTFVNRTMRTAMPIVMRAMVGIFPFFIGFAFLGICLFW